MHALALGVLQDADASPQLCAAAARLLKAMAAPADAKREARRAVRLAAAGGRGRTGAGRCRVGEWGAWAAEDASFMYSWPPEW